MEGIHGIEEIGFAGLRIELKRCLWVFGSVFEKGFRMPEKLFHVFFQAFWHEFRVEKSKTLGNLPVFGQIKRNPAGRSREGVDGNRVSVPEPEFDGGF